jgi:hypothetical protein
MLPWNHIQYVSAGSCSEFDFNSWHAALKSHSGSKCWWLFWAWFQLLTCCSEITSSMWVLVIVLNLISIANMLLWNHIQLVSAGGCSEFDFNFWHAALKSHPESECWWLFWAWFQLLTCCSEITSREWVLVVVLSLISIVNMLFWNYIQLVGVGGCSEFDFNCWHAALKSHQRVSAGGCSELDFNSWHATLELLPICMPLFSFIYLLKYHCIERWLASRHLWWFTIMYTQYLLSFLFYYFINRNFIYRHLLWQPLQVWLTFFFLFDLWFLMLYDQQSSFV